MTTAVVFSPLSFVRVELEAVLNRLPDVEVLAIVSDAGELVQVLSDSDPDVVVADIPGGLLTTVWSTLAGAPAAILLTDIVELNDVDVKPRAGLAILTRGAEHEEIGIALRAATLGLFVSDADYSGSMQFRPRRSSERESDTRAERLTPRELEVLSMLSDGLANKMIARTLGISDHTAKFHVASIMSKLNASSRTEAVTVGMRLGLIAV